MHSAGPDELVASPDDVSSDGFYTWWIFPGRGYWDEGLDFDANAEGGGGGPPHQDDVGGDDPPNPDDQPSGGENDPPRVRSYFPETLYVNPAVITDGAGRATVEIPLADSITTWRMTSLANSLQGRIGSNATGILVFQDFFIDCINR